LDTTIGVVIGKPDDYKICKGCGAINWYENEVCHSCRNDEFRELTEKDIEEIEKAIADGIYCCEDCPISV